MNTDQRIYAAIDLKSFYASVECTERGLDPLRANLVVADPSRTDKTICLAVSPSLKALGISGRARLFEVIQSVRNENDRRLAAAIARGLLQNDENGQPVFSASSIFADELAENPALKLDYVVAPPRMQLYKDYSSRIFSIYKEYISPEDIHVYSVDEVFMELTAYRHLYNMEPRELVMTMIRRVLADTGITATAGIGTNLYLAKVAMDVVAKHVVPDADGVRIAQLDEMSYREQLWCHRPIRDFWRVGPGIARRLEEMGCFTMGDVAALSVKNDKRLFDALGVNAELLIDHAWGWENAQIADIKAYRPQTTSLSSGQVLMEPYSVDRARLIVREMTELLVLDMVKKGLVTKHVTLTLGYDRESLRVLHPGRTMKDTVYEVAGTGRPYRGVVTPDHYGRPHPKHSHGSESLEEYTGSARKIINAMLSIYDRIADSELLIRRLNVCAAELIKESEIPPREPEQLSLFVDYDALQEQRRREKEADEKEKRLLKATLEIQSRYGKNAMLKGMNLQKDGTTMMRNAQIGGHKA